MRLNAVVRRKRDGRTLVVGHPVAPIGMGEHVRSVWRALQEAGVHSGIVDIYGPQGKGDPEFSALVAEAGVDRLGDGINIFCINGDEIAPALGHMQHRNPMAPGSYNIIYPAWELERYPKEWAAQLERFDEVWAPSVFIRDAIAKAVDRPVFHMPLACEVRRRALCSRRFFGIRESAYAFFFSFDFLSYVERKNPFAVIEAFAGLIERRPFADVVLVIKTNNADRRPEMKARFEKATADMRDRLVVIDDTLPELEMKSLVALTDCFVSLHRSEGFGRGISEAMTLKKPVIVTAYSGNMDFCTPDTARLIQYELVHLREGDYPHWESQHWADPNVEEATAAMLSLIDDPEEGRALGERASSNLALNFSFLAAGLRYAERLAAISDASERQSLERT